MRRRGLGLALGVWLAVPAGAVPPIAAYGQLPGISDVQISPDGARFAAILGNETKSEVQVRDLKTRALLAVTPAEKAKLRSLQWAGPDHLLLTVSTTASVPGLTGPRREWFLVNALDLKTRRWRPLLNAVEGAMNVVAGNPVPLTIDGKPMVIAEGISFPGNTGTSTLYRINLANGQTSQIELGTPDTVDWIIGNAGKPIGRADYDQRSGEWRLLTRPDKVWRRTYSETAPVDHPGLLSLGRDQGSILVTTRKSGDWQVHEVAVADGAWSPPRPEFDGDAILIDPVDHVVAGTVDHGLDAVEYRFFAESDQKLWRSVTRAFPGEQVSLASWSADRMTIIVEVDGPVSGDAFFVVDRKAKTADFLANRYPGIEPADIGTSKAFHYKATDGMEIPAFLTLPPGRKDAKGLPLIVLAHGGPEARDYLGFDWWAQAMASRGYAVLQPQFRGSAGFGPAHRDAGFGQWGRKMQSDLSDGVRQLARDGTIDPARVCIVGASYGGYAALAGVTLDAGVYRCASAVAGVSDLRRMLVSEASESGGSRNGTLRYWRRFMGATRGQEQALDAISPAKLAARVKVPVQLIHGKDDTVVRYEQSVMMEKALRAAGAEVELVPLAGEDHWLSRAPTRVAMLTALVGFIEKHNPPGAAPATAKAAGR